MQKCYQATMKYENSQSPIKKTCPVPLGTSQHRKDGKKQDGSSSGSTAKHSKFHRAVRKYIASVSLLTYPLQWNSSL